MGNIVASSVAELTSTGSPPTEVGTTPFLPAPTAACTVIANDFRARFITGVTSYPAADPDDTVVVIFFLEGCRRQLYEPHDDPDWDGGSTGVATAIYHAETQSIEAPVVQESNLWDAAYGSTPPLDHQVPHGNGTVFRPSDRDAPEEGGHIYAYACREPEGRAGVSVYGAGRCRVARIQVDGDTPLADLGDRDLWRYGWRDSGAGGWAQCTDDCEDAQDLIDTDQIGLSLPTSERVARDPKYPCPDGSTPLRCPDPRFVPQHFQVAYSPQLRAFVSAAPRDMAVDNMGEQFVKMRIRAATDPGGRWSRPIDIPINCDGRYRSIYGRDNDNNPNTPAPGVLNCYQMAAHPGLTAPTATTTIFGYYDRFQGNNTVVVGNRFAEDEAIRFAEVPLCVERDPDDIDTGESAHADYVVGKCWMTDGGWGDTMPRREVAAILWRMSGFAEHTVDEITDLVPDDYREAVSFLVSESNPKPFREIWPGSATDAFGAAAKRGEFIRLLWMFAGSPAASGTPSASDWGDIESTEVGTAAQWAYAEGITCSLSFNQGDLIKRRTAAKWIHRLQGDVTCATTESE